MESSVKALLPGGDLLPLARVGCWLRMHVSRAWRLRRQQAGRGRKGREATMADNNKPKFDLPSGHAVAAVGR